MSAEIFGSYQAAAARFLKSADFVPYTSNSFAQRLVSQINKDFEVPDSPRVTR
jgi:hypothetical protein